MSKRWMAAMGGVIAVAGLGVVLASGSGVARAESDPNGTWTLVRTVEDDRSVVTHGSILVSTYTIDTEARTITSRCAWPAASTPFQTRVYRYDVTGEGNWHIEDAGPDGRSIRLSVDCSDSTLTLTRVWFDGPPCSAAPAPAFPEGPVPPAAPLSSAGPPRQFILAR